MSKPTLMNFGTDIDELLEVDFFFYLFFFLFIYLGTINSYKININRESI